MVERARSGNIFQRQTEWMGKIQNMPNRNSRRINLEESGKDNKEITAENFLKWVKTSPIHRFKNHNES